MVDARQLILVIGTVSAVLVVPDWPHRHLTDPSYWGLVGFLVFVVLVFSRASRSWAPSGLNRRLMRLFLLGLPIIYVANCLRWNGGVTELVIQVVGLLV